MKTKLTTVQKRAFNLCQQLAQWGSATINMEWKKSSVYGYNPVIESHDGKCTNVSGCGYNKESAALSDVLCFLFPIGSDSYNVVARCGGAGLGSVQDALKAHGWNLEKTASGSTFDGYKLERVTEESGQKVA